MVQFCIQPMVKHEEMDSARWQCSRGAIDFLLWDYTGSSGSAASDEPFDVGGHVCPDLFHTTYMDDRTVVTNTDEKERKAEDAWASEAQKFHLLENKEKIERVNYQLFQHMEGCLIGKPMPGRPWSFRGKNPNGVGENSFSYAVEESPGVATYVLVKRWLKQRKADSESKAIAGQRWWSKDTNYEDPEDPIEEMDEEMKEVSTTKTWPDGTAPTAVDTPEDGSEEKGEKHKGEGASGSSPPKKKSKQEGSDGDRVIDGSYGPDIGGLRTIVADTGGAGDCGWRALSYAIAGIIKEVEDW